MFVYSVKSSKIKVVLLIALCILAAVAFLLASSMEKKASNQGGVSLKANNSEQRVAFLSQFGWEISQDPVEVCEVIIPAEFDKTYENYNKIQKKNGFNLEKYKGMRVKRWTYEIKNYPGYPSDSGCIRANMLVYDGLVIGGDVCSVELNGFMHGFDRPQKDGTATTAKVKSSVQNSSTANNQANATGANTTILTTEKVS
ncbi:MAG: DUF4830 domain-containing protein [Oscillospiraceae bacterium]